MWLPTVNGVMGKSSVIYLYEPKASKTSFYSSARASINASNQLERRKVLSGHPSRQRSFRIRRALARTSRTKCGAAASGVPCTV